MLKLSDKEKNDFRTIYLKGEETLRYTFYIGR